MTQEPARQALFDWITHGTPPPDDFDGLGVVHGFMAAQKATTSAEWVRLVAEYPLSWEMLPDAALNDRKVWEALLAKGLPQTALLRQLPRLTRLGLFQTGRDAAPVAAQLVDRERLRKARVHPVNVLVALRTYAAGHGARGQSEWTPSRTIMDALDAAFYAAFQAVEPSGKRLMLALDVSGSMSMYPISGMPLTPREASTALALVTAATEQDYEIVGFSHRLTPLAISPRQRLDDALRTVSSMPMGGTDCSLPMLYALEHQMQVDCFLVFTDNETWAGRMHPDQALRQYRERTGIDAKLIVVGMTATNFTIADPSDPGMLDVAGFDAAIPTLITDFARGL